MDAECRPPSGPRCGSPAAASSALEGTHPVLRQSPPIRPRSTSTTSTPKAAAAAATDKPPEPAPMTQMSGVRMTRHGAVPHSGRARIAFTASGIAATKESAQRAKTSCGVASDCMSSGAPHSCAPPRARHRAGRRLLRGDDAVEPRADRREGHGARDDADGRRQHLVAQAHADERRREIDEPEREHAAPGEASEGHRRHGPGCPAANRDRNGPALRARLRPTDDRATRNTRVAPTVAATTASTDAERYSEKEPAGDRHQRGPRKRQGDEDDVAREKAEDREGEVLAATNFVNTLR